MMKAKILIPVLAVLPLFFSAAAMACPYCHNQYNDGYHNRYSDNNSETMQEFRQKRAELNRLYDDGVAETDDKATALINDLDKLSEKVRAESRQNRNQSYRYNNYDDNDRYHRRGGCW
ncbi:hypothetical protein CKG00_06465 [Morganella morganii]|uniref:Uncharacterized protein n=1 Tax=Morganella morganii TaxID=582 RepID=A0A433ZV93_MORMO|nr:hypothetical protein [Morganella morganii]RUT66078.1 hypothetical protein CKG00_06465 [Morganella morganii]